MNHDKEYLHLSFGEATTWCCCSAIVRQSIDEVEVFWQVEQVSKFGSHLRFFQDRNEALRYFFDIYQCFKGSYVINQFCYKLLCTHNYKTKLRFDFSYLVGFCLFTDDSTCPYDFAVFNSFNNAFLI